MADRDVRIALVLGGGNALGAYHAGLWEALSEAEVRIDWIVGTSIGAVTGAIVAGGPAEEAVARLRGFWQPAPAGGGWPMPWDLVPETWRRTGAVAATMLGGRPGLFGPLGSYWGQDPVGGSPALYDTRILRETLDRFIDFERVNRGPLRLTAVAVDVETGEEVRFDTARQPIGPDHIRASAALLTAYPAVEIDGRLLGDGGLSSNLALDPVMAEAGMVPTLCIASDLLPLREARPASLGEVISRMQDISFAAQSRRTIERWQSVFAERARNGGDAGSATLVRLAYADQQREVAGKAMDFSPASVRERWAAGHRDGCRLVRRLEAGEVPVGEPGLTVVAG